MKEQKPENYVEKNYSRTVRYPEKSRIWEGKVFQGGYTENFFCRKIPTKDTLCC